MAVMDEFKEEREQLKSKPFKAKLSYFMDYYKWHVIIGSITIFGAVSFLVTILTAKDLVFSAALLNCFSAENTQPYAEAFDAYTEIDTTSQYSNIATNINIDEVGSDYNSVQLLAVKIMTGELDVMIANESIFGKYVINDMFVDITTVLSEEQYQRFQDDFYYIDYAIIEETAGETITDEQIARIREDDHTDPSSMENPIPVGIYLDANEEFYENYYTILMYEEPIIFSITNFAPSLDHALDFLDYITLESAE